MISIAHIMIKNVVFIAKISLKYFVDELRKIDLVLPDSLEGNRLLFSIYLKNLLEVWFLVT